MLASSLSVASLAYTAMPIASVASVASVPLIVTIAILVTMAIGYAGSSVQNGRIRSFARWAEYVPSAGSKVGPVRSGPVIVMTAVDSSGMRWTHDADRSVLVRTVRIGTHEAPRAVHHVTASDAVTMSRRIDARLAIRSDSVTRPNGRLSLYTPRSARIAIEERALASVLRLTDGRTAASNQDPRFGILPGDPMPTMTDRDRVRSARAHGDRSMAARLMPRDSRGRFVRLEA